MTTEGEGGPALVTGAARRIGRAIAEGLAASGRPVVLHASPRSFEAAEQAAAALRAAGRPAAAIDADLADAEAARRLVARAAEAFGPLTLLVNNAAIFALDSAADFTLETYERHMAVNLRAPLLLAQSFAAQLPEGVEGAIVNVIDQRALRPTPRFFTYTLSKSALWTATRTLAQAFAPRIRVNAVGPGPALPNEALGEADFAVEVAGVPLARAVEVSEVVAATLYLSSARAVTGQLLAVDSGQHLAWRTPDVSD